MTSTELLHNPIQIGTMSLRDPADSTKIIKNTPLYTEGEPLPLTPIEAKEQKQRMKRMHMKMRKYYESQNDI